MSVLRLSGCRGGAKSSWGSSIGAFARNSQAYYNAYQYSQTSIHLVALEGAFASGSPRTLPRSPGCP